MDTNDAIATLQAMAATLTDEVKGKQAQLDAVNTAIAQLQGTLTTQLTELEDTKVQLATALQTTDQKNVVAAPVDEATSVNEG